MMGILKATSGSGSARRHDVVAAAQQAKAIAGFIPDRPFIYEKLSGRESRIRRQLLHRDVNHVELSSPSGVLDLLELSACRERARGRLFAGMKQRLVVCAALIRMNRAS
jgi:ABC-2 type transport system ATP-binding protein